MTRSQTAKLMTTQADGSVTDTSSAAKRPANRGASHSAEIEYAMGNLPTNRVYDWQPEDFKVSEVMQGYFANFIKTGNPNGIGLPEWPASGGSKPVTVMHIDVNTRAEPEKNRQHYLFMEEMVK